MSRFCDWLFGPQRIVPQAGSKIRLFNQYTNEPLDGYVDAERTIKHHWPITSDMDGKFPAIYVDPQFRYRIDYCDPSDRLIYSAKEADFEPLILR